MKAIIFDLDGVICFTDVYHYEAWKKLADELKIPFDYKVNNRLRGVSRMESLNIILEQAREEYTEEEKLALAEKKNGIYVKLLDNMSEKNLTSEVKQTLDKLRGRGYLLAIGSSSKNTKRILEKLGLDGYFDAVADGTEIKNSKPDPEVFLLAAQKLGLEPADCLVVEDAVAGVEAAVNGGFCCAGLGEAAKYGRTNYKLRTFSELLSAF